MPPCICLVMTNLPPFPLLVITTLSSLPRQYCSKKDCVRCRMSFHPNPFPEIPHLCVQGQPPLSWKQGFFFSSKSDLRFGLVQMQGGPCGVLASVQAHVLAELWNVSVEQCTVR